MLLHVGAQILERFNFHSLAHCKTLIKTKSPKTCARQATLIGEEDLAAIAAHLGLANVEPARLRRNFVTRGVNLLALKGRRFRIGEAMLEYSGECAPCSRMEEEFGPGGYNAVRGHGGITARIIEAGRVRLGDAITRWDG